MHGGKYDELIGVYRIRPAVPFAVKCLVQGFVQLYAARARQ